MAAATPFRRRCRISTSSTIPSVGTVSIDELDRQIIHALHVAPRAPFRQLAAVLGVSDQTVARRYHNLRSRAGLRVLGEIDGRRLGWVEWVLRLQCRPDSARAVAAALGARPDTSWVRLASGGTEIHCVVTAATEADRDNLLLETLTGSRRVVGIAAHSLLHVYGDGLVGWQGATEALDADQVERLAPASTGSATIPTADGCEGLDDVDRAIVAVLARDGRASHADLAAITGCHEATVRRRIECLRSGGLLAFDVEIDDAVYGITQRAVLWMSVLPSRLESVGEAMAGHREVPFVAATTGSTNLMASVICTDIAGLYRYLSECVGGLEGTLRVETTPIIRTIKRSGSLV